MKIIHARLAHNAFYANDAVLIYLNFIDLS